MRSDHPAAPLLSEVVSRLPPAAREYLPFSLDLYYDRELPRRLGAMATSSSG